MRSRAFEEAGDIFDPQDGDETPRRTSTPAGGKRDALDAYVAFRGRAPGDRRSSYGSAELV